MKTKPEFELAKRMPSKYSQMERVRAARAYLNQAGSRDTTRQAVVELHAFMALFHPEVPVHKVREMSYDLKARQR